MENEPPYLYGQGNPINRTDPSGLYPPEVIERSVSPATLNILKTTRKGLYNLLRDAEDGDTADALRIYIDPFGNMGPPFRSLRGGFLECRNGRIVVINPYLGGGSALITSVDQFIEDIEVEMQYNPYPEKATTKWAKDSESHYYVRSVYLGGGKPHYYSDFAGQDSPLPDVVAASGSISYPGQGVTVRKGMNFKYYNPIERVDFSAPVSVLNLVDKFGQGYVSWGVAASYGVPGSTKVMDGYVYPPTQGNNSETLRPVILGYGYTIEIDLIIGGETIGIPLADYGARILWDTRGVAPFGFGGSIGSTEKQDSLNTYGWASLDRPVLTGPVAFKPDNGCCGQ
jgi:hypothetical protein